MDGIDLFGYRKPSEHIDDVNEVGAAVEDIMNSQASDDAGGQPSADTSAVMLMQEYARRIRLLTYAVWIIALVLIIKEVK